MVTVWKSIIQSKLDYCPQHWSPNNQGNIVKLEAVAKNFTSQISGLDGHDYWERLTNINMYSRSAEEKDTRLSLSGKCPST